MDKSCLKFKQNLNQLYFLLAPIVDAGNRSYLRLAIYQYAAYFDFTIEHNGKDTAFAQAKAIQNELKRLAVGESPSYKYAMWLKTDKLGFPVKFHLLKRFILSKNSVLKGVGLSVANYYRAFETEPTADLSAVVEEFSGVYPHIPEEFVQFLDEFVKGLDVKPRSEIPTIFPRAELYPSMFTKGPTGGSNIQCSHLDARTLLRNHRHSKELNAVKCLLSGWNASFILDEANSLLNFNLSDKVKATKQVNARKSAKNLGKLTFIPDKGGKTRSVTMGNYYIQAALRPLHDELMRALRSLECDFTYRTDLVSEHIQMMYAKGYKAYCFDMTSATDRFPRAFQAEVLSGIYGKEIGDAWSTLMSLPLSFNGKTVYFAVGQPMGLLSSFPAFSLSHHFLIRSCFRHYGLTPTYMSLGDDVVLFEQSDWIASPARLYVDKLAALGVSVAAHKSLLSNENRFVCEFTKRVFTEGSEVTPLGTGLLCNESYSVERFTSVAMHLVNTWKETSKERLKHTVLILLRRLSPKKFGDAYAFKALTCYESALSKDIVEILYSYLGFPGLDIREVKQLLVLFQAKPLYTSYLNVRPLKLREVFEKTRVSNGWVYAHPLVQKTGIELNKLDDIFDVLYREVISEDREEGAACDVANSVELFERMRTQYFICKAHLAQMGCRNINAPYVNVERPKVFGRLLSAMSNYESSHCVFIPPLQEVKQVRVDDSFNSIAKILKDRRVRNTVRWREVQ